MTTTKKIIEQTEDVCKGICKNLEQPKSLYMEKYNELKKILDMDLKKNRKSTAFMAPETYCFYLLDLALIKFEETKLH